MKDGESNTFWNRSTFKDTNVYAAKNQTRGLSYKDSNQSITIKETPSETPVASPLLHRKQELATPTLDINDTKTFTDYYSFPPITLIDDLEVWDDDDEETCMS